MEFLPSATGKFWQGNVFTPVCQSFCSQGGARQTPPRQIPPGRQTPVDTPWQTTPQAGHPQADTPRQNPLADGYCCGWYASYWNAFLF